MGEGVGRVPVRALSHFQNAFAKEVGGGDFRPRANRPQITIVGVFDLELDVYVVGS